MGAFYSSYTEIPWEVLSPNLQRSQGSEMWGRRMLSFIMALLLQNYHFPSKNLYKFIKWHQILRMSLVKAKRLLSFDKSSLKNYLGQ